MEKKARGLFDEQFRLDKIGKQNDPLVKLQQHIDFEIFRKPLERHFEAGKDRSQGGRPHFNYLLMFKILILQRYYNLSDDSTEYAILDRLSFMRFLGLTISDAVPDAKTIWNFKNELAKSKLVEKLFSLLDKTLTKRGVILNKGRMVDASIVEVPIQRNSRDENQQLNDGQIPEDWKEDPDKLRQKDVDAKWVTHNGKSYYGYKDHVKADENTKLITGYKVTAANVHDSEMIGALIDKKDRGQKLYADSAYRSEKIEKELKRKNVNSMIHEKGYRNKPLTLSQQKRNRRKSKVRARVEHIFGFMTNSMNRMYIRCRNFVRAQATIGLMNITYNLFRLAQLRVSLKTITG
jgi:transposase, IS5 family